MNGERLWVISYTAAASKTKIHMKLHISRGPSLPPPPLPSPCCGQSNHSTVASPASEHVLPQCATRFGRFKLQPKLDWRGQSIVPIVTTHRKYNCSKYCDMFHCCKKYIYMCEVGCEGCFCVALHEESLWLWVSFLLVGSPLHMHCSTQVKTECCSLFIHIQSKLFFVVVFAKQTTTNRTIELFCEPRSVKLKDLGWWNFHPSTTSLLTDNKWEEQKLEEK